LVARGKKRHTRRVSVGHQAAQSSDHGVVTEGGGLPKLAHFRGRAEGHPLPKLADSGAGQRVPQPLRFDPPPSALPSWR